MNSRRFRLFRIILLLTLISAWFKSSPSTATAQNNARNACYHGFQLADDLSTIENQATTNEKTAVKRDNVPLLQVPIQDNSAMFSTVNVSDILYVLGTAPDTFEGNWLFVEVTLPDQTTRAGFVPVSQTLYTGDINNLAVVKLVKCVGSGAQQANQVVDIDGIRIALPKDWIKFDAKTDSLDKADHELQVVLGNVPSLNNVPATPRFAARTPETKITSKIASLTIVTFGPDQIGRNPGDVTPDQLRQLLVQEADLLNGYNVSGTAYVSVITPNDYPFLYLSDSLDAGTQTTDQPNDANLIDVDVLLTFWQHQWYLIELTGYAPMAPVMQQIFDSFTVSTAPNS